MKVTNVCLGERCFELITTKMRITSGTGKLPDIGDELDLLFLEQGEEILEASRRMADGPDLRVLAHLFRQYGVIWSISQFNRFLLGI